ncbi:hypothetical protein QJS04_geneDACA005995 [Acorus gramineus]|uniref:KIB1-4 beta-propeller domain-containing protein n=1 Tax=Acorus gramineus TaxID=55184 RepID=A0AAV9B6A3_ACOGR|nr:hypothetical protein QJS04_geneDACA005995 [Acorus gramineus]
MVDNRLDLSLLNPFSRALVTLPPLRTNSISEPTLDLLHGRGSLEFRLHENGFAVVRSGEYMRDEYLTKAVWSAKPTDDNCVIVILLQEAYRIVYCRLDETCWIEIQTSFDFLSDAIFYKEKLYVVRNQAPRVAAHSVDVSSSLNI